MMQLSYWERETFFQHIDIAIIGSGIVGLNAAITLREQHPDWRIVLLERGILPTGASTKNAGFACFGSLTELMDDLTELSENEVFSLVEKRWRGLNRLRERVGDANLEYKEWGGYEVFRAEENTIYKDCLERMEWFNDHTEKIVGQRPYSDVSSSAKQFGFQQIEQVILNAAEGQIHTGRMMQTLLKIAKTKGVEILNGFEVAQLVDEGKEVVIEEKAGWQIKADRVLVATNGFAKNILAELKVVPARNQVVITKPIENLAIKGCFHYDRGYFYFRNINNRILLGGGRNLSKIAEETDTFGQTNLIQSALEKLLKEVILPNQKVEIDQRWSGILGVGNTKEPILCWHSENIAVAVRLGGMGVAIGSLLGEEAAELFK